MWIKKGGTIHDSDKLKGFSTVFRRDSGYLFVTIAQLDQIWEAILENRRLIDLDKFG